MVQGWAVAFTPMDPGEHLGYLIVRAGEVVSRSWLAGLRKQGVNPRQFSVLALIARDAGLSQAELARRALITPQSMSELLTRLLAVGLVERSAHDPGRAAELKLTAAGRRLLTEAYPLVADLDAESVAALSPAEQATLARLLRKLIAARSAE